MRAVFVFLFTFVVFSAQSQIMRRDDPMARRDTTSFKKTVRVKLDGKTTYKDYKVITVKSDTTYIDTTLTIKKEYKFNYIRKDNFELLQFHNQGQTFTQLGKNFRNKSLMPLLGATAKHYDYYTPTDIHYYRVATPSSEAMYKAGFEQGQMLDFFVTMNLSPQFNIALSNKGLRSLGKYRNALASHKNFKVSMLYHSKDNRYDAKFHYYAYNLMNQENGGITEYSKELFERNEKNYRDRARLLVNYTDANSRLKGRRLFLKHSYSIFKPKKKVKKKGKTKDKRLKTKDERRKIKADSLKPTAKSLKLTADNKKPKAKSQRLKAKELKEESLKEVANSLKPKADSLKRIANSEKPKANSEQRIVDSEEQEAKKEQQTANSEKLKAKSQQLTAKKEQPTADNKEPKAKSQKPTADSQKPKAKKSAFWKKHPKFNIKLEHLFSYETKGYSFEQSSANEYIGEAFTNSIKDTVTYKKINNRLSLSSTIPYLGNFEVYGDHLKYNYFFNGVLHLNGQKIPVGLKSSQLEVGGQWKNSFKSFYMNAQMAKLMGGLQGSLLKASAGFKKKSYKVEGYLEMTDKTPDFNKVLYQSDYQKYNWYNDSFKNENIKVIGGRMNSKWGNLELNYTNIHNYTYFDEKSLPKQLASPVGIMKLKISNEFSLSKFHLANTIMYQQVTSGADVYRVPKLVTRNTLYYQDGVFKGDPLLLQVGIHFRYFTKYKMDAFNPVLNEFYLQNKQEIGNYPVFDFFANGRVRQTRLYFKVENFAGWLTGFNYYSAPNHPYRDLVVRFGLVWNWFM